MTDLAAFILTGIPINADFYQLRAEPIGAEAAEQERVVSTGELQDWLRARDCEFCAHQVKLLKQVRCAHPPFTAEDLSALGFQPTALLEAISVKEV